MAYQTSGSAIYGPGGSPESWAAALERLLPPGQAAAIEQGGATAVFEASAGGEPIIAEMLTVPVDVLTERERLLLGGNGDMACRRWGVLRTRDSAT